MPRLTNSLPKYRKHASGQARVTLNGRTIYLGPWGTKASRDEYDRVVGEWQANGRRLARKGYADTMIVELVSAFWKHVKVYYAGPGGVCGFVSTSPAVTVTHRCRVRLLPVSCTSSVPSTGRGIPFPSFTTIRVHWWTTP